MDTSFFKLLGNFGCRYLHFFNWGIWYSPAVFGKAWMKENGFTEESLKGGAWQKYLALLFFWV